MRVRGLKGVQRCLKPQSILQHCEPVLFKCFTTCMTHPILKLKCSILLVVCSAYNAFYCHINCYYSLTLVFFDYTGYAFCYSGHVHVLYQRAMLRLVGDKQRIRCLWSYIDSLIAFYIYNDLRIVSLWSHVCTLKLEKCYVTENERLYLGKCFLSWC